MSAARCRAASTRTPPRTIRRGCASRRSSCSGPAARRAAARDGACELPAAPPDAHGPPEPGVGQHDRHQARAGARRALRRGAPSTRRSTVDPRHVRAPHARGRSASGPTATTTASDFLDNDGISEEPREIRVTVRIRGDDAEVDFTGSSAQSARTAQQRARLHPRRGLHDVPGGDRPGHLAEQRLLPADPRRRPGGNDRQPALSGGVHRRQRGRDPHPQRGLPRPRAGAAGRAAPARHGRRPGLLEQPADRRQRRRAPASATSSTSTPRAAGAATATATV